MKKLKKINLFWITFLVLILIVALAFFIFFYNQTPKLTQEEILTQGTDNFGDIRAVSVVTNEELFNEIDNAVKEHLGE